MLTFLGCIYIMGFLITPYWALYTSRSVIFVYCFLTIGIGVLWLFLSTDSLQIEFNFRSVASFLALLAVILLLNFRALNSVIPFRGDETLHIERTQELAQRIPALELIVVVLLFILFLYTGWKLQRWLLFSGSLLIVSIIFFYLGRNPFEDVMSTPAFFAHYPFINYWMYAVFPKLLSPYQEILYRIVPFISMLGVAWLFQKRANVSHPMMIGWGVAAATIPIVFYYSSILYIEPPAVLLMTIVCLDIKNILEKSSQEISRLPSWYALILIGFIKETTVAFLVCFLGVRMLVQLSRWQTATAPLPSARKWIRFLAGELGVIFAVLIPVIFYIYFRTFVDTRSFSPHLSNLLDTTIYPVIARAFWEQFGLFVLFFISGCIVLLFNREYSSVFCYGSLIVAVLVFHILDTTAYVGYSRFNLFLLPPILAGSLHFTRWVALQKRVVGGILLFVSIASNLLLSPVHLDGVKTPYWGNYLADTSEHYYPYQDAILWLKQNYPTKRVLFTGLDFYYPFQFYWNKWDWKPSKRDGVPSENTGDEQMMIANILDKAQDENYDVVIYRVLNEDLVVPGEIGKFRVQLIKNSAHTLIVFYDP